MKSFTNSSTVVKPNQWDELRFLQYTVFLFKTIKTDEWSTALHYLFWWRGGLVVGRRTCDLVVAGSRPGDDAAA